MGIHQRVLEHALQHGAAETERAAGQHAMMTRGRRTDQTICPATPSAGDRCPSWLNTSLRLR